MERTEVLVHPETSDELVVDVLVALKALSDRPEPGGEYPWRVLRDTPDIGIETFTSCRPGKAK